MRTARSPIDAGPGTPSSKYVPGPLTIIGVDDDSPSGKPSHTSYLLPTLAGEELVTWTKLGDEFSDSAAPLSDAAFRTHVEALGWSNRRLLDLLIPKSQLKRFAETDDPDTAVKELVETGWWQDGGDAWFVGCYFPEWQRERVQVEHRREQEAIRQRRKRRHDLGYHDLCQDSSRCKSGSESEGSSSSHVPTRPGPSRPDPGHARSHGVTEQIPSPGPVRPDGRTMGKCGNCQGWEPLGDDALCPRCTRPVGQAEADLAPDAPQMIDDDQWDNEWGAA